MDIWTLQEVVSGFEDYYQIEKFINILNNYYEMVGVRNDESLNFLIELVRDHTWSKVRSLALSLIFQCFRRKEKKIKKLLRYLLDEGHEHFLLQYIKYHEIREVRLLVEYLEEKDFNFIYQKTIRKRLKLSSECLQEFVKVFVDLMKRGTYYSWSFRKDYYTDFFKVMINPEIDVFDKLESIKPVYKRLGDEARHNNNQNRSRLYYLEPYEKKDYYQKFYAKILENATIVVSNFRNYLEWVLEDEKYIKKNVFINIDKLHISKFIEYLKNSVKEGFNE